MYMSLCKDELQRKHQSVPGSSDGKESACKAGDLGSIPGSRESLGVRNGNFSSILAWEIPRTEGPGGYSPWGQKESDKTELLTLPYRTT